MLSKKMMAVFMFIVVVKGYSQVHNTTLEGRVSDGKRNLEGVHVFNISTGFGKVSDDLGLFEINVRVNDTLLFSSLQHKNRTIRITREQISDGFIVVQLETQTTELEEVTLHHLSGNMTADLQKVPKVAPEKYTFEFDQNDLNREFEADRIDRLKPPDAQQLTDPIMMGAGAAATFPLYGLEAEYRLRRKLKEKNDYRVISLKKLGSFFFTKTLKIEEDEIYKFLDFCESEEVLDCFRRSDLLSLIQIFKEQAVLYHER